MSMIFSENRFTLFGIMLDARKGAKSWWLADAAASQARPSTKPCSGPDIERLDLRGKGRLRPLLDPVPREIVDGVAAHGFGGRYVGLATCFVALLHLGEAPAVE